MLHGAVRENDHYFPQRKLSLLMWWTVPAPGSEVPLV